MNAELKKRWIEALRSGKYEQANSELRKTSPDRFCCLGVLCEVAGVPRSDDDCGYDFGDPRQADEALLFGEFARRVGADKFQRDAAKLNDDGTPFSAIADWIEKNVAPTD